jgi:hypothetical protein
VSLKPAQCFFFLFQSETSFNLISEKCDILSILRDHPENRIYQRKIQVGQRVRGTKNLSKEGWGREKKKKKRAAFERYGVQARFLCKLKHF